MIIRWWSAQEWIFEWVRIKLAIRNRSRYWIMQSEFAKMHMDNWLVLHFCEFSPNVCVAQDALLKNRFWIAIFILRHSYIHFSGLTCIKTNDILMSGIIAKCIWLLKHFLEIKSFSCELEYKCTNTCTRNYYQVYRVASFPSRLSCCTGDCILQLCVFMEVENSPWNLFLSIHWLWFSGFCEMLIF